MEEITLQALLEAGCHFGHKTERWHPKAAEFIYTEKDGVHIIDLAKTKTGLEQAVEFIKKIIFRGGEVLLVGSKRQARGVVREEAERAGIPYLVERWIGGFLTNWDGIKKNIEKINRMSDEEQSGAWKNFPKHERSKLSRYLARLKVFYGGVLNVKKLPDAIYIVDVRKEYSAVREAIRRGIPIVAIVDTNSDPRLANYPIPANDDAVGSIKLITNAIATSYMEGKSAGVKASADEINVVENQKLKNDIPAISSDKEIPESKKSDKINKPRRHNDTN